LLPSSPSLSNRIKKNPLFFFKPGFRLCAFFQTEASPLGSFFLLTSPVVTSHPRGCESLLETHVGFFFGDPPRLMPLWICWFFSSPFTLPNPVLLGTPLLGGSTPPMALVFPLFTRVPPLEPLLVWLPLVCFPVPAPPPPLFVFTTMVADFLGFPFRFFPFFHSRHQRRDHGPTSPPKQTVDTLFLLLQLLPPSRSTALYPTPQSNGVTFSFP